MDLRDLDLNLLLILQQVLAEQRVSKAAEKLSLSQPAVSSALARLRKTFGDELVVPTPKGMKPTPFAELLAAPVTEALGLLQEAINQSRDFDPRVSPRTFRIGMTDIGEIVALPVVLQALAVQAPNVAVSVVPNGTHLREEMEAGRVDVAFGQMSALEVGFHRRQLFWQRYVLIFRTGHPLAGRNVCVSDFCAAEHLVVDCPGTGHGRVEELLLHSGVERNVQLTLPHFTAIGHILRKTDLIATVPERFAQSVAEDFALTYVTHPVPLPEVAINLSWHSRVHNDPSNRWFRELLIRLLATPRS